MSTLPDQLEIKPLTGPFNVTIDDLPGSKSLTNRALLLAALLPLFGDQPGLLDSVRPTSRASASHSSRPATTLHPMPRHEK